MITDKSLSSKLLDLFVYYIVHFADRHGAAFNLIFTVFKT